MDEPALSSSQPEPPEDLIKGDSIEPLVPETPPPPLTQSTVSFDDLSSSLDHSQNGESSNPPPLYPRTPEQPDGDERHSQSKEQKTSEEVGETHDMPPGLFVGNQSQTPFSSSELVSMAPPATGNDNPSSQIPETTTTTTTPPNSERTDKTENQTKRRRATGPKPNSPQKLTNPPKQNGPWIGGFFNAVWGLIAGPQPATEANTMQRSKKRVNICRKPLSRKLKNTTWISACQLCVWDNVLGPRVEAIWNGVETIDEMTQVTVARHTLGSDMQKKSTLEADDSLSSEASLTALNQPQEIYFFVLPEMKYALSSSLFSAPIDGRLGKFSFVLYLQMNRMSRFLDLSNIFQARIGELVRKIRGVLCAVSQDTRRAIHLVQSELVSFSEHLEQLFYSITTPLPSIPTLFHLPKINSAQVEFLSQSMSCLMQTDGVTVVVGSDVETIDPFISTLSLLLNSDDRKRCSYACSGLKYAPDLFLQGLLLSNFEEDSIIESLFPTTIINVDSRTIKQTYPYHEYVNVRIEYTNRQIQRLLKSNTETPLESIEPTKYGFFRPFTKDRTSQYLLHKIAQALLLPIPLREGFVRETARLIVRRAVVLIKYVEGELNKRIRNFPDNHQLSLAPNIVRRLRADLGCDLPADFALFLGVAEKYCPGIYVVVAGEMSIETQYVELFG